MVKFCQFVGKILRGNEILASIKGHNSGTKVQKMIYNNPKLDLVNMNAYIKFGEISRYGAETKFWRNSRAITLVQICEK